MKANNDAPLPRLLNNRVTSARRAIVRRSEREKAAFYVSAGLEIMSV